MQNSQYNANLIHCKHCNNLIAKTAKYCPICGGKNKKPFYRRPIILILLSTFIFLSLLVISVFMSAFTTDEYSSDPIADYYELSEAEYKSSCTPIAYEDIARNSAKYDGTKVCITGEIFQKISTEDGISKYLIQVTPNTYGYGEYTSTYYSDIIYIAYYHKDQDILLEDDIVTIYGTGCAEYTYTNISGSEVTVPSIMVYYADIIE